jgi:hypothetical protein
MADKYGLVSMPVALATGDEAAGDPAISRLLAFLQSWLNANGSTAWAQVMPGAPLVRSVFSHNPEEVEFNERHLPALFAWREEADSEQIADDILLESNTVQMLWVFPPTQQSIQRKRQSFLNALWKLVDAGIERGRTPGYLVVGDPDPLAASQGSLLYPSIGAWSLKLKKRKRRVFVEQILDGKPLRYFAVEMAATLEEDQTYDLTRYLPLTTDNRSTAKDEDGVDIVTVRY